MHHMVTTEHSAKLRCRKRIENNHSIPGARQEPRTLRDAAVRRLQDQPSSTGPQPLPRLVEPRDGLARAPGETQQFADPPNQSRLEHGGKIGGYDDRATCGPGEGTPQSSLGAGGF